MSRELPSKLHFAEAVSHVLGDFAHTYNIELIDKSELMDVYETAREIIAEETEDKREGAGLSKADA